MSEIFTYHRHVLEFNFSGTLTLWLKISAVFLVAQKYTKEGGLDCCGSRTCDYQIPLERPPGGARIRAEDLFGMWSSTWEPEKKTYNIH